MQKGTFGYIQAGRKKAAIYSFIFLTLCFSLFFYGLATTGTNRNLFSVLAALACLPMGIFVVRFAIFLKAHPCSKRVYDAVEARRGGLIVCYDMMMTASPHNFSMSAVTALANKIVCLTEDDKMNLSEAKLHITRQIALSKYHDYEITITTDPDAFILALDELNDIRIRDGIDPQALEDAWRPGTVQTVIGVLKSISL